MFGCAGCNECPEKREGLVNYPKTTVSEEGGSVVTVTTECVENAELASPSLEVTCSSGGIWGSEHPEPECKCTDNFKVTEAGTSCVGKTERGRKQNSHTEKAFSTSLQIVESVPTVLVSQSTMQTETICNSQ